MKYFMDLFSGIGGFALGAYWAGLRFDGHYFSEVDDYAIKIYRQRFPDAIGLGDIRKIKGDELPRGDWIIAGGFPCQDISVAGKGAGLAGERSGLWFEYARLIGEIRPRYAIMENVGALSFRGLETVLGSLAKIGYDAEWCDVRASDVGAPHRRERLWIVAYPQLYGFSSCSIRRSTEEAIRKESSRERESLNASGICSISSPQTDVAHPSSARSWCVGIAAGTDSGRRTRRDESALRQVNRATGADRTDATGAAPANVADAPSIHVQRFNARQGKGEPGGSGWWATEPDVGRVAHGIPARVDRLKCLGNSIVPQIAEMIFTQDAFDEFRGIE